MKELQILIWKSERDDLKITRMGYRANFGEMVNNSFPSLSPRKLEEEKTSSALS